MFERYYTLLRREIAGYQSLLDVGCGFNSPIRRFRNLVPVRVGVDGFAPAIDASRARGIHTNYVLADLRELERHFAPVSFDVVLASDVIEHFTKDQGLRLLEAMERIARHRVIVFTPNGFVPQSAYDDNDRQEHLSGWDPPEMRGRGYRVIGVNGWKPIFGERARIAWRPKWVGRLAAALSRPIIYRRPELAFQILCVKDLSPVPSQPA
jgi:SAM-dependent methyltransferase